MGSTLNTERIRLNDQYEGLRSAIISHYGLMPLVGRVVSMPAYKLPGKLGHWHATHSDRVLKACPELEHIVHTIERLAGMRSAELIAANHIKRKPGGRRRASSQNRVQTNPGEWPAKFK